MLRFGNSLVDRALLTVLACLGPTVALAGGIQFFEGSFEEALARAEEEDKHVFVDVYATWCGPCKVMDAVVFPRDDVGEHYNANFINVKLDAEDESINGPAISERYDVGAYPTYLYLNPDGSLVGRALGALPASLFVQVAEQLTGGLDSGFAELEARYKQGERDPEFVQAYLWDAQVELALFEGDVMQRHQRKSALENAANEYFSSRDFSELINPRDFALIACYKEKKPRGDALVEYVIDNYDAFLDVAAEIALARLVLEINFYAAQNSAQQGDEQYLAYLGDLSGPLKSAADYLAKLEPDSELLYDSMAPQFRGDYLAAAGRWEELLAYLGETLAQSGADRVRALRLAGHWLGRSPEPEHKALVLAYTREAYELAPDDWSTALSYSSQLIAAGETARAREILQAALDGLEGREGVANFRDLLRGQLDRIAE